MLSRTFDSGERAAVHESPRVVHEPLDAAFGGREEESSGIAVVPTYELSALPGGDADIRRTSVLDEFSVNLMPSFRVCIPVSELAQPFAILRATAPLVVPYRNFSPNFFSTSMRNETTKSTLRKSLSTVEEYRRELREVGKVPGSQRRKGRDSQIVKGKVF